MSGANAINVGILWDWMPMPPLDQYSIWDDYRGAVELTFSDAHERGLIDRPIELVVRQISGLPRGSVRAVIDAYKELVEAGCVLVLGPLISENVADLRRYVEGAPVDRKIPYMSWAGSDEALSHWGFALNNAGFADETLTTSSIMHHDGIRSVFAVVENSLIGKGYLKFLHDAAEVFDIDIRGQFWVPQLESDKTAALEQAKASGADAIIALGFGYGLWGINDAMEKVDYVRPFYGVLNFPAVYYSRDWMHQLRNFIGLDQYDERNPVGQRFLDRFAARYGRRPDYYLPLYGYDSARIAVDALRRAEPISGWGVREALERVKGLPAACGAPGTWLRFNPYVHQGWMGAGCFVARQVNPEGTATVFKGTIEPPTVLKL